MSTAAEPGLNIPLQKWLDRGFTLAAGFSAPTSANDCTTVFLETEALGENE